MGKNRTAICAVIVLVFFGLIAGGCRRKQRARAGQPPLAEMKGDLNILHISPQGPTQAAREADEIVIIFDQAMVPLQPLPQEEAVGLLRLEPPLAGTYRWMGTKTLTFSPKKSGSRMPHSSKPQFQRARVRSTDTRSERIKSGVSRRSGPVCSSIFPKMNKNN